MLNDTETKRLRFRLLETDDFESWLPFFYSAEALRNVGMSDIKSPEAGCQEWIDKCLKRYAEDKGGMNVLIDKKTGHFIGQCGLLIQEIEGETLLEIGYSILPAHRGKGYATEAAQKCKDEAFEREFSNVLISMVHIENDASKQVILKNDMSFWKHIPYYKGHPVNIYRITRESWMKLKNT